MKVPTLCFALLLTVPLSAQGIEGDWHGVLDVMGAQLRLVFHLETAGDGFIATLDSPDQNAFGIPVDTVVYKAPELTLKLPDLMAEYHGSYAPDSAMIRGTLTQRGMRFPLDLQREAIEGATTRRPQHPEAPFPYRVEEVTFNNTTTGITLAGTLTFPAGEGPFPAAVLISGSGPQDRDETLMGHKPFLVIADHLTRQGIAVLRFDDRGVGASTGNFSSATTEDFAGDVQAAIDFLHNRPIITPDKIGLIGHSEGGLVAPIVATRSPESVAFMVLLAAPGVPGDEIILRQQRRIATAEGQTEEAIQLNQKFLRKAFALIRTGNTEVEAKATLAPLLKKVLEASTPGGEAPSPDQVAQQLDAFFSPWFQHFVIYDPTPALEGVPCPVLALNGARDLQVDPAQNLPAIEAALQKGKNPDYTIKKLLELNHLFQHAKTGAPSEYPHIEETFAPEALQLMAAWIRQRVE